MAGKALVAYFSWSGNCERMAQRIAEACGADLFRIVTRKPYSKIYPVCAARQGRD